MNWEKLGPNLSFTVENKARNLHKAAPISNSELGIPLPQILRIYCWIGKNELMNFLLRKVIFWTHHELDRPWIKMLTI